MKKLVLALMSMLNIAYATQSIQVYAYLEKNSSDANLMLLIEEMSTGKKTPESMYLHAGQNLATFQINDDHYRVIPADLQAPHMQFTPCTPTQVINNHSLIINITGEIAPNKLRCAYREVTTLPQLSTPAPTNTVIKNSKPAIPTDPNAGNKMIANYLTALGKDCQKGKFIADFDTQTITYDILGMNAGHCAVNISTNQLPPLQCSFNQNDIALLASPTEIDSYKLGTAQYSDNSLSAKIMKARCKSEVVKK